MKPLSLIHHMADRLQRQAIIWPLLLGSAVGLGIGAGAFWGVGGALGAIVCLLVLAPATWFAKDANPVFIGLETPAEAVPQDSEGKADPIPDPAFVEPLDMVELPGGTFRMGSSDEDEYAVNDEKPQHEVTVSDSAMSRYAITRRLYRQVCATIPEAWASNESDARLPANHVSWFNAIHFCNALSNRAGLKSCYQINDRDVTWDMESDGYRLPTEAEWEYACRSGTTTKWFWGNDESFATPYAWFNANSDRTLHPVGEKEPNAFGLYDMSGNVLEWCWDWYGNYTAESQRDPIGPENGRYRVLRGGAWNVAPSVLRSAFRDGIGPELRGDYIGFRCVRRPRRQL